MSVTLPRKSKSSVLNPENSISWKDVNDILRDSYNFQETIDSTALDILALYLKGQKIVYTESKTLCEKRLNTLMLPAIFIAAVCSILNFILKDYQGGTIIISCLNAFILSLISYLKLDAKAESHKMAAYKFQKLESMCEFNSGKSLFFSDSVDVCKFVTNIENQVMEIRESNQFIIPEHVRVQYPKICQTNVFTLVKEIQNDEIIVINNLKTVVQHLHSHIDQRKAIEREMVETQCKIESIVMTDFRVQSLSNDSTTSSECSEGPESAESAEEKVENEETRVNKVGQLSELRNKFEEMECDLLACKNTIDELDRQKNEAFDTAVKHRARYLKMSETFKDEITVVGAKSVSVFVTGSKREKYFFFRGRKKNMQPVHRVLVILGFLIAVVILIVTLSQQKAPIPTSVPTAVPTSSPAVIPNDPAIVMWTAYLGNTVWGWSSADNSQAAQIVLNRDGSGQMSYRYGGDKQVLRFLTWSIVPLLGSDNMYQLSINYISPASNAIADNPFGSASSVNLPGSLTEEMVGFPIQSMGGTMMLTRQGWEQRNVQIL